MALKQRDDNGVIIESSTINMHSEVSGTTNKHTNAYENSLGFSIGVLNTMSFSKGSDYVMDVAQAISARYQNLNTKTKPMLHVFDKEIKKGLAYSAIVVSLENDNLVAYFTILLEATGRESLSASEIMAEYNNGLKNPNISAIIYTPDDAMDQVLMKMIDNELRQKYTSAKTIQSVDGVVLSSQADIQLIAPRLAAIAYNACSIETAIEAGRINDLNIETAISKSNGKSFKIESYISKAPNRNELEDITRTDWKLDLNIIDQGSKFTSLNMQDAKQTLIRTGGYIDAVPYELTSQALIGQQPIRQIRLRPQIVITSCLTDSPTLGYALLGTIMSFIMTQPSMWLAALKPTDPKNNVGSLNVLTNIENNPEKGELLNLADRKYESNIVYSTIQNMFNGDPIVCFDVASYGPQSFFTSAFSVGAGNGVNKTSALEYIIDIANWLTSGRFPQDFNINDVFANDGIVIPLGRWSDSKGVERDIREIDLAFIASHTRGDINFLTNWALSNIPKSQSGIDPYMTKINIIEKIVPDAKITGKAVRVTFSNKFISTLEKAVIESGLNVRFEPQIQFTESNNLNILNRYLQNAGISNAGNFAHATSHVGPNYTTNYSNVGYQRWK